jgi:hypothetical protein
MMFGCGLCDFHGLTARGVVVETFSMAWRIDEAVIRGEIDNSVEGRVTGRIWLVGRERPLVLSLDGDCWRDLAGAKLMFENPEPEMQEGAAELVEDQSGVVGDMTASRKFKVALCDDEEMQELQRQQREVPYEWKNALYLEWFSEINGRVVIESADYVLTVSDAEWRMDQDAEEAQKLANLNAMRDFMAQVIQRRESAGPEEDRVGELDEFAWEERLKESDRLTDAYQEVLEKYMDDEDSERKEAFVMGWDGLLDALAERDEAAAGMGFDPADPDFEMEPEGFMGGDDDDDDEEDRGIPFDEDDSHPLQIEAQELALRAMDLVKGDQSPGTPSYRLMTDLLQVSGKLAGALNGRGSGYEPETGFVLAVLKRCLNWLNDAMGACQELIDGEEDADHRAALERLRESALEVRGAIVELRRELNQS